MNAARKIIPASALALSLVMFTSCRVEDVVSDLKPYFKEVTAPESSLMSALSAATSPSSNTTDFKEGFKSGYAAGYAEAAKTYIGSNPVTSQVQATPISRPALAPEPEPEPISHIQTVAATSPNTIAPWGSTLTTANLSSDSIPSWGYTSSSTTDIAAAEPEPAPKPSVSKSTSSYKSSSNSSSRYNRYSRSRSSRNCYGGT